MVYFLHRVSGMRYLLRGVLLLSAFPLLHLTVHGSRRYINQEEESFHIPTSPTSPTQSPLPPLFLMKIPITTHPTMISPQYRIPPPYPTKTIIARPKPHFKKSKKRRSTPATPMGINCKSSKSATNPYFPNNKSPASQPIQTPCHEI